MTNYTHADEFSEFSHSQVQFLMKRISQTSQNETYLEAQRSRDREHVFLGEVPFPKTIKRARQVLAVEGNRVYLKTPDPA